MDIQVTTKNLKIEEEMKSYAESKLSKLSKYLNNISSIKLELTEEKSKSRQHLYTAQVTVNINGFLIRGEHKDDSLRASVDNAVDVMERLIDKFKKRYKVNKGRVSESIRKPAVKEEKESKSEDTGIVKLKRFNVKPMTVGQAIDQMEFLGHDFFLFVNYQDKSINVVYRRKDGKYGLIQPELA